VRVVQFSSPQEMEISPPVSAYIRDACTKLAAQDRSSAVQPARESYGCLR
jgi:hypothetical protein